MPAWRPPIKETPRIPKGGRPAHAAAQRRELEAWRRKLDEEWERQQQERKDIDDQKSRIRRLLNEVEAIAARHQREVGPANECARIARGLPEPERS